MHPTGETTSPRPKSPWPNWVYLNARWSTSSFWNRMVCPTHHGGITLHRKRESHHCPRRCEIWRRRFHSG